VKIIIIPLIKPPKLEEAYIIGSVRC